MQFRDRAVYCRSLLRKPDSRRFKVNRRGVLQMSNMVSMLIRTGRIIKDIGKRLVFFTEQDPNSYSQPEAQLVRIGVWNSRDVGWLWTRLPDGKVCFLAKVTPKEVTDLNPGWITEQGEYIIDLNFVSNQERNKA